MRALSSDKIKNKATRLLLVCTLISSLSACSLPKIPKISMPSFNIFGDSETDSENKKTNPKDLAIPVDDSGDFSAGSTAILTRPPGADEEPGKSNAPESAQTRQNFDFESLGMRAEPLFIDNVQNDEERFVRLERAVQDIQNNFNQMAPSLSRLISIEEDLQSLVIELQALLLEEAEPEPVEFLIPNAPTPLSTVQARPRQPVERVPRSEKRTPTPQDLPQTARNTVQTDSARRVIQAQRPGQSSTTPIQAQRPPVSSNASQPTTASGTPILNNVRVGEYGDKMRLVFDLNKKVDYAFDYDVYENIFTLTLNSVQLGSGARINSMRGSLIGGTSASNSGSGQLIAIDMNRDTDLINNGAIAPTSSNPSFRLFFDFAK